MRHNQIYHVSRATCAFALSLLMAASLLVDGIAATPAYAEEGEAAVEGHLSQDIALDANGEGSAAEEPTAEENAGERDEGDAEPAPEADETPEESDERVSDDLPLVEDKTPAAKAGMVVVDGLKYRVNSDGKSAELAGWHGAAAPERDVTVAARVVSGTDEYAVTKVAKEALKGCDKVESVVLPDTLVEIGKDAFAGCAALRSIVVGEANEKYASYDGMLFSKDLATLILCPEGKGSGGGASLASLPVETTSLSEDAFSGCTHLTALAVDEKNAAFASMGGLLLSKDLSTLVYAPAGIGASVTLPSEVREVAAGAFAECAGLKSIVAPGNVESIGAGAFPVEVVANATVALAPGEDYDARKAVWQDAGFTHFSEPAAPGEVTKPSQEKSGFAYRILDDFTLAVSWEGEEEPEADLVLPTSAEIDGVEYRVTAVAANGFQGRTGLSSVQIRAPITTIGDGAFDGCTNLSQVELPDGLDYIGSRAFAGTALRSVTLPASLKTVAGGGAFTDCSSLERVVALSNNIDVANDALAGCSGVSVYAPYDENGDYPWSVGLPASGNHILPYGLTLVSEPLSLEVGQSADLFESGLCEVPDGCELSYSYAATPISVDAGQVTGKKPGTSEVTAVLALDTIELARATRTVEVTEATVEVEEPTEPEAPAEGADAVVDASDAEQPQINEERPLSSDAGIAPMSLDGEFSHISYATTLATSETVSFTSLAPTGQLLQCTVLADDPSAVEVAAVEAGAVSGHLVIPATVQDESRNTYTVRRVAAQAFSGCTLIRSVSFAQGSQVESIGDNAFSDCQAMESCALPQSLKTIGKQAFYVCYSLKTIEFPDSVTELGNQVLALCTSLTSVTFGKGITKLPNVVFEQGESLATLHVRGSIDTFGILFQVVDKSAITVLVPSVKDKQAWESANLGLNPEKIIVGSGVLHTVTFDSNGGASGTFSLTVESGLPIAEPSVGKEGSGLEGWYTEAGDRWDFATNVTGDMCLQARWVEDVQDGDLVFRMRSDGASLVVFAKDPATVKGDVVIPESHMFGDAEYPVTEVGNAAFIEAKGLTSVDVPASVKSIGTKAFGFCTSMTSVRFSGEPILESIGTDCFYKCALDSVTLPRSLKRLHRDAFSWAPVRSVVFEEGIGITSLPSMCFANCANLEEIVVPDGVRQVDPSVFSGCGSLASVSLPEGLQNIGEWMFWSCPSLESIVIPSTVTSMGKTAFYSCPKLAVVYAQGSMKNAGVSAAFDSTVKASATVILPAKAQDGTGDDFQTMKAAWKGYGFDETRIVQSSGALPIFQDTSNPCVANDDPALASWSLSDDGMLTVRSTVPVGDFGWLYSTTTKNTEHWGPVRALVKAVDTTGLKGTPSFACWFREMPQLADITRFAVPENLGQPYVTTNVSDCFTSSGIDAIPVGFKLPEGVLTISAIFNNTKIAEIPDYFVLPQSLEDCGGVFMNCPITEVPDSFARQVAEHQKIVNASSIFDQCSLLHTVSEEFNIPVNATDVHALFYNCSSLTALPEGLVIPAKVTLAYNMLRGCTSLTALPKNFRIPDGATNVTWMFNNCPSLTSLPTNFDMSQSVADNNKGGLFGVPDSPVPIPMYYDGKSDVVKNYTWTQNNRTFVSPEVEPAGAKAVTLNIKAAGETGEGAFWTKVYTDASGMLAEPAYTPSRPGMVFTLWYSDPDCTQRVDFSKAFEADTTIYGKLASGSLGGELPTVAGTGSAFWSLADDGTLYIRGSGKVGALWPYNGRHWAEGEWGPWRDRVAKVSMDPSFRTIDMINWFRDMVNLVDVSEVVLPETAYEFHGCFCGCTSLETIPEGFALPVNTSNAGMMFQNCSSLRSLPDSFSLPEKVKNVNALFSGCSSLVALPANFSVPDKIASADAFMLGCTSLTSLPDGFDFPEGVLAEAWRPFWCVSPSDGPRVATYYNGTSSAVLNYDWASQNRVLISEPADRNKFAVTFKVANDDGTWTVRATTLTNDAGLAPDLGTISREGYAFTGWCADEECLVPFDFSKPLDSDREIYGKWILAGGKGTDEGKLPTVAADGTTGFHGWWRLDNDGSLHIRCDADASVASLGWAKNEEDRYEGWWGDWRAQVRSVKMQDGMKAVDMENWFACMGNLVDASGVFLPENTVKVSGLFLRCVSLEKVADDLKIPDGVESTAEMFRECGSLKHLPSSINIPYAAVDVSNMFRDMRVVEEVPSTVRFADAPNLVNADRFVQGCWALKSLPVGLSIPESVETLVCFADDCRALVSLPEGFSIPQDGGSIKSMPRMFYHCGNLAYLPASFKLSGLSSSVDTEKMFFVKAEDFTIPVVTYYPGNAADVTLGDTFWADSNRKLVSESELPDEGKCTVSYYLPDGNGVFSDAWTNVLVSIGEPAPELVPSISSGLAFAGWFTASDYATKFDFSQPITGKTVIYGKYVSSAGPLPTVADPDNADPAIAGWSLSSDGTLTISCQEGQTIADLGWIEEECWKGYWGPLRANVKRVEMSSTLKAQTLEFWFMEMGQLTDAQGIFIPEGTTSVLGLFNKCSSLSHLPDDFTIPEGVESVRGLFRYCRELKTIPRGLMLPSTVTNTMAMLEASGIERLPEGWTLPEGVEDSSWMFSLCKQLVELPADFVLPDSVRAVENMFDWCNSLRCLPANFTIPKGVETCQSMFRHCYSLKALPDGFSFPENPQNASRIFWNCVALTSLPASLNLKALADKGIADIEYMFGYQWNEPVVSNVTYYAGNEADVLGAEYWSKNYKRVLVTDAATLPDEIHLVTLKTQVVGDSTWATYQTVLSDASGKVADPGTPSKFGYAFSGWKTETGTAFDFANDAVNGDMTLYGTYTMITRYEVPLKAKVSVDATGKATPAVVQMRSFTPVPLSVNSIRCDFEKSATDVLDRATLDRTAVTVAMPLGEKSLPLYDGTGIMPRKVELPAATSEASPGVLEYAVGVDLPDDALVKFWGDGWTTPVAKLTYTVGPVS